MGLTGTRFILVSMEDTPGTRSLPFVGLDVEMLHCLHLTMSLDLINAKSEQDIVSKLPEYSVFPFVGHDFTDRHDPSEKSPSSARQRPKRCTASWGSPVRIVMKE
jgi:hypothetical protein